MSEGADILNPILSDGADDKGDSATVTWPDYNDGPESIDTDTEGADWDDAAPEMEADIDMGDEER